MYDLEVIRKAQGDTIPICELKAGQLAVVVDGGSHYMGHYLLCEEGRIADLSDPEDGGWDEPAGSTLRCLVLPPGDELLLTVRE